MAQLMGMPPKACTGLTSFVFRLIDAIQMANDEHLHTKENMARTCMLDPEYVGTVDFSLEEGDYDFLWRKVCDVYTLSCGVRGTHVLQWCV